MDLDTEFRRRQAAMAAANPSLRTAATQTSQTPQVLKPITSANLPAPVIQPIPTVQTVQQPQQTTPANGYSVKQRADKGFDFFDPNGNKTTIESYTKATGANGSDLRQGMAASGDKVSQQIIANDNAAKAQQAKPKQNFIQSLPGAAADFGKGVWGVLRGIGGGLVDGVNFASRIPQTIETAKDSAALGIDDLLHLDNKHDLANAQMTQMKYDSGQKILQDVANAISGDKEGNSNADTTREANAISQGKADPGEVVSAIIKSLTAATTVPVGKVLTGGEAAVKAGETAAESTAKNLPVEDLEAIKAAGGTIDDAAKASSTVPKLADDVTALPAEDQAAIKQAGGTISQQQLDDAAKAAGNYTNPIGTTNLHIPGVGHVPLNEDQAKYLADEVNNIKFNSTDRPHLTAKVPADSKELTPEELAQASPNAKAALDAADEQARITKAQTGDAGAIEDAGKTTSPDVAQADISSKAGEDAISAEKAAHPSDIASEANSNIQTDQKLLSNVTDTTKAAKEGPGFVTADSAHPLIAPITKRLGEIDRKLSSVAEGKKTMTREEISALKTEREGLINQAREPFTKEGVSTANTAGKVKETAAGKKTASAEQAFPDASPEDKVAIQKVLDELNPAERAYNKKTRTVAQQKASRIAQADKAYQDAGGGEAGMKAKFAALGGKYKASDFEPLNLDDATKNILLDKVEKSDLRSFEKFNTQNALQKVWGSNPEKPAAHDIAYIRKFFNKEAGDGVGDELASGITKAIEEGKSWEDVASNIAGLPRALMATGDLSGGFRQALPLGTRFPKEWANANKESVKYALNPKYFEKEMKKMSESDSYATITDKLGVDLPGIAGVQDEGFIGAGYAEKIPVAKIAIKAADRAYTGVLTKLRYDVADKLIEKEGGVDQFLKNMKETYGEQSVRKGLFGGKMVPKDDRAMKALGEVINTFTGRGGMKGGLLDEHMKTASTLLFAPRLWAANLQRLNPGFYARLARDNPQAAKLALQSQGTFLGVAGLTLGLASAAGAEVGMDPRSADFGKIKVGNTRYDIMGGQQQNIVLLTRLLTGEKMNSETGEVVKLGQGYGAKNRVSLLTDMFDNKSNPLLAYGMRLLNSSTDADGNLIDEFGKPYSPIADAAGLVTPLGLQGTAETIGDTNSIPKGILMNIPSFFGVGVQTYGSTPSYQQGAKDANGKISFKGKVTNDMVTDAGGNVILDDKNVPVKITIPKDATPAQIAALKTTKAQEALKANFKASQTKEDVALMGLNKDQLAAQVKSGSITQEHADKIDSLNAQASATGGAGSSAVQSQPAKTFYDTYDKLSDKEKKSYLDGPADDNAKTIATQVNAQRTKGLDEFQPSNKLSKLYADYEKDIVGHPEYTLVDKQNKAKSFQADAAKSNLSTDQSDIYTEGGSDDLKNLIDNGSVKKADLDKAVALDDQLYNSGVTSSLKFSKKFRGLYGYSNADGSAGGSSSSSASDLTSFLPSAGTASQGKKPTFSSKPRSQKISFKTNLPKKSSKKISIKL